MNIKSLVSLALLGTLVSACDGRFGKQSAYEGEPHAPTADQSVDIEEEVDRVAADVLPQDSLVIHALPSYNFIEGEEGVIELGGHTVLPDVNMLLDIQDVELLLPGSKVVTSEDGRNVKVTWRPEMGFAYNEIVKRFALRVRLQAQRNNSTTVLVDRDIQINVYRQDVAPEIVYVEDMPKKGLREGSTVVLDVKVRDPESVSFREPVNIGEGPQLHAVRTGVKDISPFVTVFGPGERSSEDPEVWDFKVKITLSAIKHLTTSVTNFTFGLMAVSRYQIPQIDAVGEVDENATISEFNVPSPVVSSMIKVVSTVEKPATSWADNHRLVFYEGKQNYFSFSIFDPRQEGRVEIQWKTDLRKYPGLLGACREHISAPKNWIRQCHISWDGVVRKAPEGEDWPSIIPISFVVLNHSKAPGDELFTKETFKQQLLINRGPLPVMGEVAESNAGNRFFTSGWRPNLPGDNEVADGSN